ncbi:MAG: GGDEF domain-containing protein [Deinococcus sp.]|nr:GGDEF domain-containing protein [Deinococcus sp.]
MNTRAERLIAVGRWLCGRSIEEAYRCTRQAVEEAEREGETGRRALAQALNLLGNIEIGLGQPGAARVSFRRAREEALRLGDIEVQFKVANNMALLHHTAGEWHSATQQFLLAQELGRQSDGQIAPRLLSILQVNMAHLYTYWGDPERTLHLIDAYHLQHSPEAIVRAHVQLGQACAHLQLAEQSERLARPAEQAEHLRQAEQILAQSYELPPQEVSYYNAYCELEARLLAQRGDYERAIYVLTACLDGLHGRYMDGEIDLHLRLGKLLLQRPDLGPPERQAAEQSAELHLNTALTLMDCWGKHHLRVETLEVLAGLYEAQRRLPEALAIMHQVTAQLRGQIAQPANSTALLHPVGEALADSSLHAEWQQRLQLAEGLARRDALTGINNRRSADETLPGLLHQLRAPTQSLHLLLIDLDHFKCINDNHSHAVGDRVLQRLAQLLPEVAGLDALTARYGGEEFLVALPGVRSEEARRVAEQIRLRTMQLSWDVPGLQVTVSVGLTRAVPHDTVSSLISRADEALYRAKRTGRNRVVEVQPPMPPAPRFPTGEHTGTPSPAPST